MVCTITIDTRNWLLDYCFTGWFMVYPNNGYVMFFCPNNGYFMVYPNSFWWIIAVVFFYPNNGYVMFFCPNNGFTLWFFALTIGTLWFCTITIFDGLLLQFSMVYLNNFWWIMGTLCFTLTILDGLWVLHGLP